MATSREIKIVNLILSDQRREYEQGVKSLYGYLQPIGKDILKKSSCKLDQDNILQDSLITLAGLIRDKKYVPSENAKLTSYFRKILHLIMLKENAAEKVRREKEYQSDFLKYSADQALSELEAAIDDHDKLESCIKKLSEENRKILVAFYINKRKLIEIHEEFRLQYNTIKQRISSIRKQLKKCIST